MRAQTTEIEGVDFVGPDAQLSRVKLHGSWVDVSDLSPRVRTRLRELGFRLVGDARPVTPYRNRNHHTT